MRANTLATAYLQAGLFMLLGVRCLMTWMRSRDARSGHLATATVLFGLNSLISAVNSTLWDAATGEQAPRIMSIVSGIVLYAAVYAFLLFLSDFIRFPTAVKGLIIVTTVFNMVMAVIERPGIAVRGNRIVQLDVDNPIPYRGYLWYVIIYLALTFGALGLAFLIYGLQVDGLARFRMVMIASGFLLLFLVVGLLPLLIFGSPTRTTFANLLSVIRYVALASAPLLFLGFSPPKLIASRFHPETSV